MAKILKTDEDGVKDFREIREAHKARTGETIDGRMVDRQAVHVIDVIEIPTEADDKEEFAARLVKKVDDAIEQIRDVSKAFILGGRPFLIRAGGRMVLASASIHLDVQLTEELDAATAAYETPATATANVLTRDPSDGSWSVLQDDVGDVSITVTHHREHWDALPAHTCGTVCLMNDEWRPVDFDCDAAAGGLIS